MILLGLRPDAKREAIEHYVSTHDVKKVFCLSAKRHQFDIDGVEWIEYNDIIQYRTFYRLLQDVDQRTLVVLNECLRSQNRYELTYNCIRHFLRQTSHHLIFQYLPMIEQPGDFMGLFDWDTQSRWKPVQMADAPLHEASIVCERIDINLRRIDVQTDDRTKAAYEAEKRRLIDNIGLRDPHTIPRNLYLMGGKAKLAWAQSASGGLFNDSRWFVGRNSRFHLPNQQTYRADAYNHAPYTAFELPHNFLEFTDFLYLSGQTDVDVLVSDLKVDQWYWERYQKWRERLGQVYAQISCGDGC